MQSPFLSIEEKVYDTWWKNIALKSRSSGIYLVLPGLKVTDFQPSFSGGVTHSLSVGARRITTVIYDRYTINKEYEDVSYLIEARLSRVVGELLLIRLEYPKKLERVIGKVREELLICLQLKTLHSDGGWITHSHQILFDPEQVGRFPSVDHVALDPPLTLLPIDINGLEVILNG